MPYNTFNLQLFGEEGADMAGSIDGSVGLATDTAGVSGTDVGSTEGMGTEQFAAAEGQETWSDLIKGKYKKEYNDSVKAAVNKRFKNQQNLQGQIDRIDPIVRSLASKYKIAANPDGSIPIDKLQAALDDDDSALEEEAFQRGIPKEDLKQMKSLERENEILRRQSQRSKEAAEWDDVMRQGDALKQVYPNFDLETELSNDQFGRTLASLQKANVPNALQAAYEIAHRDEIMGGAMRYAVSQTEQKISNSIQSGMRRPAENGTSGASSSTIGNIDPSKLTREQLQDIYSRASRGERITF